MKKLIGVILSLTAFVAVGILTFEFSYKLSPEEFITDKTTFIYSNQNLNAEKVEKFEKIFKVESKDEKELLRKIKSFYLLSESKIYNRNVKIVGIVDTGIYYPFMLTNLKKYFNDEGDYFYSLKDEKKEEVGLAKEEEFYLKAYRGLFFLGINKTEIDKIIQTSGKKSLKTIEILRSREDSDLGTFVFNQERERLFGIDRVVFSGNAEENKIFIDGSVYGDNNFIKDLSNQPAIRRMNKYIDKNKLYFSMADLRYLDTFILRAISMAESRRGINIIKDLFTKGFSSIFSQLNGEIVCDLENGNYLLGMKTAENEEKYTEYFQDYQEINIEKDIEGNMYICIGNDTFVPVAQAKDMAPNQFFSGKITTYYGEVEADGFSEKDSLRIKVQIDLKEKE